MTEADRRFRQRLVAVCLLVAPLLIGVGQLITGDVYDDDEVTLLTNIASDETRVYVGNLVSIAGAFCLPLGILGMVHLVRVRKRVFGTIAGAIALFAAFGMPGTWLAGSIVEYIAAQQPDKAAMAALLADMESDAAIPVFLVWISFMLGTLLLGIGLILARSVPRWAGAGVIVAMLSFFAAEGTVGEIISSIVVTAAFGAVAWSIWTRTPEQWENGELPPSSRGTAPATAEPSPA